MPSFKQRGVKFGPKPKLTPQQIAHARYLRAQGEPAQVIAALFNVHRATIYRVLADEDTSPFPVSRGHPPLHGLH
jgi:DNA invertase Pin-like site-specific DNA recombinase